MKRSITMITMAALIGGMAVTAMPAEAKGNKSAKKTTASTASKLRPGYSLKKTTRKPARSAASVLKRRDAKAKPRTIVPYKSARTTRSMESARRMLKSGKPAKSILKKGKPGVFSRIGNWFTGLFSSKTKPRAAARKVTFRETASVQLNRLGRTPSGRVVARN